MNAEQILRRAAGAYVDLYDLPLTRHELDDLVDRQVTALLTSSYVVVIEDPPEDEDEAMLVCPPGIAVEAWPVSSLAANGVPLLPVWTSLAEASAREPLIVFELPRWAVLVRRRWWRFLREHEHLVARARAVLR